MDIGQRLQERRVARPVVVVFTAGGGSTSIRARNLRDRLKASGVLLHVVGARLVRDVAAPYTGRVDDADREMSIMFDDGVKDTGGRVQEFIVAEGIEEAAEEIVDELLNQYVISYTLPPGVEPNERPRRLGGAEGRLAASPAAHPGELRTVRTWVPRCRASETGEPGFC